MKSKKRDIIILIIITAIVIFFAVKDDFSEVTKQLTTVNLWFIIVAFIFIILYWVIRAYAVHCLIKEMYPDFKFRASLQLMLRTQFFNAVTPFATGGQPYQIYYLHEKNISTSKSTGIILENFIVYQIALVFLGVLAIIINHFGHLFPKIVLLRRLVTLGFIINFLVVVVLFFVSFAKKMNKKLINLAINVLTKLKIVKNREETLDKWNEKINEFHESAFVLLENKWLFVKTILLNLLALVCLYMLPLFILYSLGDYHSFNWYQAIVTSAYVMLLGSFVPIPGGSGGLEYGFVAFYGNFLGGPILSALMLIWRFITYYFGMIVGAVSLNMKRVK